MKSSFANHNGNGEKLVTEGNLEHLQICGKYFKNVKITQTTKASEKKSQRKLAMSEKKHTKIYGMQ